MSLPDAAEFDRWYRVVEASTAWTPFVTSHLGLPSTLVATGYLGGAGLTAIGDHLGLTAGETLVDLGCGRGGYGLALIAGTGAELIGIDFSVVAVQGATADAVRLQRADRVRFQVGDLTATGLPAQTADAVICVDALQFAVDVPKALAECRRILRPGGRLVITTWQAVGEDARLPERLRRMDLHCDLTGTGFLDVQVLPQPAWSTTEVALWSAARDLADDVDPALVELSEEATAFLPLADALVRVLAVARCPGGPAA